MGIRVSSFDTPRVSPSQPRLTAFVKVQMRTQGQDRAPLEQALQQSPTDGGLYQNPHDGSGDAAQSGAWPDVHHAVGEDLCAEEEAGADHKSAEGASDRVGACCTASADKPHQSAAGLVTGPVTQFGSTGLAAPGATDMQLAGAQSRKDQASPEDTALPSAPQTLSNAEPEAFAPAAADAARLPLLPHAHSAGAADSATRLDAPYGEDRNGCTPCPQCGQRMRTEAMQEHKDWHVAHALSAVVNGPGYLEARSRASASSSAEGRERESERMDASGGEMRKRRKTGVEQGQQPGRPRGLRAFFGSAT
jgi:Ubiquitin-Binding Zinc Finger